MTVEATWYLIIGGLLIAMALARKLIAHLPMTGAMVYLAVGFVLGPAGFGLLAPQLTRGAQALRLVTEAGLVISLFAIGMHLRVPLRDRLWRLPLRLGTGAMLLTIAAMTAIAYFGLGLSAGLALIVAAALAPTDPVLANELRPREAGDADPLRFALSGEGGCNDGAAWPFMLLGLAWCGVEVGGAAGMLGSAHITTVTGFAAALLWGIGSALAIGWLLGAGVVALVTRLRLRFDVAVGVEGFLALGLMSACYGAAQLVHGYAFVAVFVAGVALRHQELRATGDDTAPTEVLEKVEHGELEKAARTPELAHAYIAESMMAFAVEIEQTVELVLMLLIGSVVSAHWRELLEWRAIWPALALLLVVRPLSALAALAGSSATWPQRLLAGWLGIRGVGAFYYLMFAIERLQRVAQDAALAVVMAAIVGSVLLHGVSATLLLDRYLRTPRTK
ncbi:cation:proton antiporter [Paraburkholderia rhizosphaerae]|uniref:Sodium/proton antiporter (CPA1 family) n=1 Tax=Paraburkholderia rhizosphaerae TaxID=480658 RepID=A0A4V3HFE9_9BURK|nr:cation:proton antiporter [Paraburkholderia rhizosphaerae]TDY52798.1 sodium/proton antiporter (CPA1 family) [Paraburkholderia rhizosphaerae]